MATCRQSPLASYCHCHVILIMMSRAYGGRSSCSLYGVILIVTSFAIQLARPPLRTYGHLTVFNI